MKARKLLAACLLLCPLLPVLGAGPTVEQPLGDVTVNLGAPYTQLDLARHFSDPNYPGTVVRFSTVLGDILVELYDEAAPLTVANFLNYVNDGDYANSIFHRLVPGFVLQGGGFKYPGWWSIPTDPPVPNEFGISNTRGTLAMAKQPGDPNSATSQWFFNLADNSATLDTQNGGFTVFGHVILDGMTVVDALAAIPTYDFGWDPWRELPLMNYGGTSEPIGPENVVMVYDITVSSSLTFTVTNDNPALLTASVSGSRLTLQYLPNQRGVANITVRATDEHGLWVEDNFTVEVKQAPTAVSDKAATNENEQALIAVLANDLPGDDPIDQATVTVVSPPANGTAAPNPLTGTITYTPNDGFYGVDTFTYKVADTTGWWSNVATVRVAVNAKPILLAPIPDIDLEIGTSPEAIDLSQVFTDIEIRGHIARFNTTLGTFDVELHDAQAPRTVANFRKYVSDGDYTSTLIHRVVPNFVVQGGGYKYPGWQHIPEDPPIANEFGASNVRGTIAMAKLSGDPNSATSEWFFNLVDNSANLDYQNGGFTVFGHVLGDGMDVVDAIAAVPTYQFGSPYEALPLRNYTTYPEEPGPENVILVNTITIRTPLTYTIILDTPGQLLLNATINDNTLTLGLQPGQWGTGTVTIRATDEAGASVETTFQVNVTGPPLANDDAPTTDPGVAVDIPVLLNDIPRGHPIDPATVTIVTPPQFGNAVVNPATGVITYTPPAGFVGPDPFTYMVRDVRGRPSNTATVNVAINFPGFLVGTGHPGTLRYTDPDGTVVTLTVKSGLVRALFVGFPQLVSSDAKTIVVGGAQVNLHRLEIVQSTTSTSIVLTTTGGTTPGATLGGVVGTTPVGQLSGPSIDLVGEGIAMTGGGYIATVVLRDVRNGADVRMPGVGATKGLSLTFRNIPDAGSDIRTGSPISSLTLAQWAGSNLVAPYLSTLTVTGDAALGLPGNFGANVTLHDSIPAKAMSLATATIAGEITSGTWELASGAGTISAGNIAAAWRLNSGGVVSYLRATNLAGTIAALRFGAVAATREFTATLTTTDTLAANTALVSLTAGRFKNANVTLIGGAGTLSVSEWQGGQFRAARLSSLVTTPNTALGTTGAITGAALTLTGAGNPAQSLGTATLAGKLSQSIFDITGNVGSIRTASVDQCGFSITGNLSSFAFNGVTGTWLWVGGAIGTLQGVQWDGGTIIACSLVAVTIKGDPVWQLHGNLFVDLTLTGQGVAAGKSTLGKVSVSYAVGYGTWNITGGVDSISAYIAENWTLNISGAAKTLNFSFANTASVSVGGLLSKLTTSQWNGGSLTTPDLPSASLGVVNGLNATIGNTITTLTAVTWLGGSITAKTARTIDITGGTTVGDFSPNLTLTGAAGVADTLGTLNVARRVLGGTWRITGNVATVNVFSWFQNCKVRVTGNIKSFTVGAMDRSLVYAGVADITALPSTAAHFTSASTIQNLTVVGLPTTVSPFSFVNSNIAAHTLASVSLVNLQISNGGTPFGVAGRNIQKLSLKQNGTGFTWPSKWPPDTGDFVVRIVP